MTKKKVSTEIEVIAPQEVEVQVQETSPFQKNQAPTSTPKKLDPFLLMALTYLLVTGENATDDEMADVVESRPQMKVTEIQKQRLLEMGLIEEDGGKLHVTRSGVALILKGCTFGVNFEKMLDDMSFNALIGLFIKCGNRLATAIRQPITLRNKQGETSKVSIGIREVMQRLYEKIEWPEEPQQ